MTTSIEVNQVLLNVIRAGGAGPLGSARLYRKLLLPSEAEARLRSYEASATINASPEVIWAILTDAPGYTTWDSGVVGVEGRIARGEKLKVTSEANPKRAFGVQVTELQPGRAMTWSGGMPLGLFKGVRRFTLTPGDDATGFTMREEYTGPLLPLIWKSMPDLQPSFDKFVAGLKSQAESPA
jgi:hypothetical protein